MRTSCSCCVTSGRGPASPPGGSAWWSGGCGDHFHPCGNISAPSTWSADSGIWQDKYRNQLLKVEGQTDKVCNTTSRKRLRQFWILVSRVRWTRVSCTNTWTQCHYQTDDDKIKVTRWRGRSCRWSCSGPGCTAHSSSPDVHPLQIWGNIVLSAL